VAIRCPLWNERGAADPSSARSGSYLGHSSRASRVEFCPGRLRPLDMLSFNTMIVTRAVRTDLGEAQVQRDGHCGDR
jgi:hypothetical protein